MGQTLPTLYLIPFVPSFAWRSRDQQRKHQEYASKRAHLEMEDISHLIAQHRIAAIMSSSPHIRNVSIDAPETTTPESHHLHENDGKNEIDELWHKPHMKPEYFRELPPNHRLSGGKHDFQLVKPRVASALRKAALREGITYHFALSSGHSGTTTLSNRDTYENLGFDTERCFFGFETLAQGTREYARWHPSRESAQHFVARYYLPSITNLTLASGKKCFVDFGHHLFFGHILSAIKRDLGPAVTVLRLRRSRLDTAASYAIKRKKDGPCGTRCVYCICPEEQWHCLKVKQQWRKLTIFQRFLWMVDEVECRWQTFIVDDDAISSKSEKFRAGSSKRIDLDWRTSLVSEDLEKVATFIGLPKRKRAYGTYLSENTAVLKHKAHVSKREELQKNTRVMEAEDLAYRSKMQFSAKTLAMLNRVFF